ncbi:MAG: acetate--CoA ligase family protein [Hyphomicrobiales bacterium]|nr:acetate--CoA ligase family protein [Hyphomicrobiales bacterium]MCP5373329.1 acetate--CoA ligase family protein [Hyphomicrobiales bacterium]
MSEPAAPGGGIAKLLNPASVAILGATEGANRVGGRVLRYMLEAGFQGPVYPVNPGRDTVQGRPAFATVGDIPGTADCAILAIPARAVAESLRACAAKGVGAAVVFSSGFAEMGAEGRRLQAELGDAAREAGVRLLGPNCLGAFNAHLGFMATFSSNLLGNLPVPGAVGIVSQSGAFGAHLYSLARQRGIGLSYWVTTGNEVDITLADCIAFMANAGDVNTIVVYAEGINDPDGLRAALDLSREKRKPVIFLKVGRTEAGAKAAHSHTASLAVSDVVCDALFRQTGTHRAETTEEMIELAYACQMGVFPAGNRVGVLTMSGGVGVQMADVSIKSGMAVPELPADLQAEIKGLIPFAATANPVDVTASAMEDTSLLTRTIDMLLDAPQCDSVGAFMTPVAATDEFTDQLVASLAQSRARHPDKPFALCMPAPAGIRARYEAGGNMVFDTPERAVDAFAALARFRAGFERGAGDPPPALPAGAEPVPAEAVGEVAAKAILAAAGIPVPREVLASDPDAAVAAAADMGGPVAMKIVSPDIAHKTEIGGVLLGVAGADAVAAGFATLMDRARAAHPGARLDGVSVAEMVTGGVETVIGAQVDPTFGPVVMFGLGGIFVEVLKDVSFRLAPFGVDEARRMVREIRGFPLLAGARGAEPADLDALAQALARVSAFAAANADRLESLDINPFRVLPKGALALDALIVPKGR